jgi:signal transduction histidine kinase
MRERAAMLGGSFTLRTAPGGGTRIRIEIPVQGAENE